MSVFTRSYIISSVGLTVILQNKKKKKRHRILTLSVTILLMKNCRIGKKYIFFFFLRIIVRLAEVSQFEKYFLQNT